MTSVECPGCGLQVDLPSGLAMSAVGENPAWKGVSCPWCFQKGESTTISADDVRAAFQGDD